MSKKFKINRVTLKLSTNQPDWFLLVLVLGLMVFGIVMVANVSVVEALRDFGDQLYFFKLQARWALMGLAALAFFQFTDYHRLKKLAFPLLLASLLTLVVVLLPWFSAPAMGARRWLAFGGFRFQPAELTKLSFTIYLSIFLSGKKKTWPFILLLGGILALVMMEPDLGTALIISLTGVVIYFASGAPLAVILSLGGAGVLAGLALILSSDYRRERLLTFLNPTRDPLGASYHIHQILIAVGSGGITGLGLGQSRQKHEFLPAVTTDSIFAVIGEELGLIGATLVLAAFLTLIWRGMKIAREAPDKFGRLLAVGITAWIGLQALINLAAMVALVPLTGVPLPFISYGGSSLVIALSGIGILLNVSKQRVVEK